MKGTEVLNQWQNATRYKKQYKKLQTQKNPPWNHHQHYLEWHLHLDVPPHKEWHHRPGSTTKDKFRRPKYLNLPMFKSRALNRDKLRWPLHLYNLVLDDDPTILPCVMFRDLFLRKAPRCLNVDRQEKKVFISSSCLKYYKYYGANLRINCLVACICRLKKTSQLKLKSLPFQLLNQFPLIYLQFKSCSDTTRSSYYNKLCNLYLYFVTSGSQRELLVPKEWQLRWWQ